MTSFSRCVLACCLFAFAVAFSAAQSTNDAGHDGPAELPRIYIKTTLTDTPTPGKTSLVKDGESVQRALDHAACGDTIELQAGATFESSLELPAKSCDDRHWIIVRSASQNAALPPEGTRISPCYAGITALPGRPDFHCASTKNVMARIGGSKDANKVVSNAAGANHYRFIGVEFADTGANGPVGGFWDIILLKNADHIIFDRCWIHGSPTGEDIKGLQFEASSYISLIDSFITDIHSKTSANGADSSAVGTISGIGPVKIVNNFLEGAGENVLFGGGRSDTNVADVEFRHNYVGKPLMWWHKHPSFFGTQFAIKNLFETKGSLRLLIEGNIFENSWAQSQKGTAILFSPKNQYGECSVCAVQDTTFRYNILRHAVNGIGSASVYATTCRGEGGNGTGHCLYASGEVAKVSIHDNILDDINVKTYAPGDCCANGFLWSITTNQDKGWPHDISIEHNTGFPVGSGILITSDGPEAQIGHFTFRDNLVGTAEGGIRAFPPGGGKPKCTGPGGATGVLERCFSSSWIVTNNIIIPTNEHGAIPGDPYPKTPHCGAIKSCEQYFPESGKSAGMVDFHNGNGGDYRLAPSSHYRKKASDGKDPGADIDAIGAATAGVLP